MINNTFIEDYKILIAQNCPAKFPIIFCHHMHSTETKVYKQDVVIQQTVAGIDTCPKYFKEQNNYAMIDKNMSMLNVAFLLYCMFKASNVTSFNKWL